MVRGRIAGFGLALLLAMAALSAEAKDAAKRSQPVRVPGTEFVVTSGTGVVEPRIVPGALAAIATWLANGYGLPALSDPPEIKFVPAAKIVALRNGDRPGEAKPDRAAAAVAAANARHASDAVAVYLDAQRTIYLAQGWTGRTPAELSVLVHEMVHHLQNLSGENFDCPQSREKLAYAAQRDWLKMFGRDFHREFGSDPMTLLLRSSCGF